MDANIVGKAELSRFLGFSEQSLTEWQKEDPPMPVRKSGGRGEAGEYDTHEVVRWLIDRGIRKAKFEAPRDRLARVQADKTQLEVDELGGQLGRVDDFVQRWSELITGWRAKLLAFPTKIAQRIAPPERMAEVQAEAQAVVHELVREFSADCLPPRARARRGADRVDMAAAADADGKPVGRSRKDAQPGVKPRARKVGHRNR